MLQFIHQTRLDAPAEQVFAFHERDDIFNFLIPPWQKVRLITREGGLKIGARVKFRIYLGPLYVTWIAVHTEYERNRLFTDEQEAGPFAYWRHRHTFEPDGGGCILRDQISYSLPIGMDPVMGWLAGKNLRRMFRYRHESTSRALGLR